MIIPEATAPVRILDWTLQAEALFFARFVEVEAGAGAWPADLALARKIQGQVGAYDRTSLRYDAGSRTMGARSAALRSGTRRASRRSIMPRHGSESSAMQLTTQTLVTMVAVSLGARVSAGPPPPVPPEHETEIIVITGSRTDETVGSVPYAATALSGDDIVGGRPTLSLGESLAQVPGVFVSARSNFAQDARISIRGFGARAAFGVRGIRIFLDGIPLTLPDGQSQTDSIDLANVGRMEVLRGPAGTLYGNATGGVLYLETPDAPEVPQAELFNMFGSRGTWKLALAGRGTFDATSVSLFASRTRVRAFRDRSDSEQLVAQAQTVTDLTDDVRWSTTFHYVNAPLAEDPGGLTPSQFREGSQASAEVSETFRTGEVVSQVQIGTRLMANATERHRLEISLHAGIRDFESAIPFRTVSLSRDFFGGLVLYRWREPTWLAGHRLTVGVELQGQEDRRSNQGNRQGRPDGEFLLLQTERARSVGVFAQERLTPVDSLTLLASVRYDRVDYEVADDLLEDGDASGRRGFDQLTAQAGLIARPWGPLEVFGNVSQSYETPTLTELVNSAPDGGLSSTLEAQHALSLEVGARFHAAEVAAELSAFYIDLTDELVAGEDHQNRTVFTNAGASRRIGAEASVRVRPIDHVELLAGYSWLKPTFEDDAPVSMQELSRAGNVLPGLPEHRIFGRVRYDDELLFAAADLEWVDARFADDANSVRAPAHTLVDLRAGVHLCMSPQVRASLTLGVRNLFDVAHVDNVRPNAFGDRYFEPGPPLHVYGALLLGYGASGPP